MVQTTFPITFCGKKRFTKVCFQLKSVAKSALDKALIWHWITQLTDAFMEGAYVFCALSHCLIMIGVRRIHAMHDDIIKWKHFPRYWSFVRGIQRSPVNSPYKGQWRRALVFFFYLRLNQQFSKQWRRRLFETPSHPLWRHCNGI